jgi:hypothetical protein
MKDENNDAHEKRFKDLRDKSLAELRELLENNRHKTAIIADDIGDVPSKIKSMSNTEKVDTAFKLLEEIKLMFGQYELKAVINEKENE